MAETWSGLQRKGLSMSKSSPSLAAAFSLRDYSKSRKKIPMERPKSQTSLTMEEIDRLGGNGRWRQRQAEEFFKKQAEEELERQRELAIVEEKKRKRRQELEARRRRQQQEEEMKRQAEIEREQREQEEREERRRLAEERERQIREQEHQEWLARQPQTCEDCQGSGLCTSCDGKGELFSMFLVSQVGKESNMGFGRAPQGCEDCGGCKQNILGGLQKGSGKCAHCNGKGKVWPKAAFEYKTSRTRFRMGLSMGAGDFSPKSMMSSPKVAPTFA